MEKFLKSLENSDRREEKHFADNYILATEKSEWNKTISVGGNVVALAYIFKNRGINSLGMVVGRDQQGKGLGNELMEGALEYTKRHHYLTSQLWPENIRIIKLHGKYGFVPVYEDKIHNVIWYAKFYTLRGEIFCKKILPLIIKLKNMIG